MVVMMMVVVVVMPVCSRGDPDVTACTMVMVVMMVMSDHNLGSLDAAGLREPFIVGL
jgi:hypothetical protein